MKRTLKASTLVELLVMMSLSGLLLLAVYDGLDIINGYMKSNDSSQWHEHMGQLEQYEILEFRSDSIITSETNVVFYIDGKPVDTLINHGF